MKTIPFLLTAVLISAPVWALEKAPVAGGATPGKPAVPAPPAGTAPAQPTPNGGGPGGGMGSGAGRTPRLRPAKADPAAIIKAAKDELDAANRDDKAKPAAAGGGKGTGQDLDFIEMNTGDKMYGKIHSELSDSVILLVGEEDQGRIKVPKYKIKNLNFSMGTRLKALEPDDFAGQYKVGLWAMEKNMYPQAIELFESLKEQEGVPPEMLKQLGKAYHQRGQLDKALEVYREYVLGNQNDAEAGEIVAMLNKEVNPVTPEAPVAVAQKIVEGLEADGNWIPEVWDNANQGMVTTTKDTQTGNKMIAVQSVGGLKDKTAFSRYAQPLDLSASSDMVFKIFNKSDAPISLGAAFVNAQGDFHESKQIKIPPKTWVNQSFKVEGKNFKSNRNEFKDWTLELQGREHIGKITFLVYGQKGFTLYLDSLFFKEAKPN